MRNSAKAVIIQENKLLVVEKADADGPWFLLPGGGQEFGETLPDALKRECMEELGASVKVGKMVFSREYIGKNHEFAHTDSGLHQVEFYFLCELVSELDESKASLPDENQTGVKWLDLGKPEPRLYPSFLMDALQQLDSFHYYGDRN